MRQPQYLDHADLSHQFASFIGIANIEFALDLSCVPTLRFRDLGEQGWYGCYERLIHASAVQHTITIGTNGLHRSRLDILATLLHECLHMWQAEHGTPSGTTEHNEEFRDKARSCGLIITDRGANIGYTGTFADVLDKHGVLSGDVVPRAAAAIDTRTRRGGPPRRSARTAFAARWGLSRVPEHEKTPITEEPMSQDLIVPPQVTQQDVSFRDIKGLSRQQRGELKRQCQELLRIGVVTAIGVQTAGKLHDLARAEYQARIVLPYLDALEKHDLGLVSDRQLAMIEAQDSQYEQAAGAIVETGLSAIKAQVRYRTMRG